MLDHNSNQAAGLLGLNAQTGPRMVAVVSHGDEPAELPLLWQMCMVLVNLGYAVTVLDATSTESEANPGLAQLLDDAHWRNVATPDTPAWTVLPALHGVQSLCSSSSPSTTVLNQLGQLFPNDGVIVLYSRVEWIVSLAADSRLEPLLAVSRARTSLLTSYLALKRLLITGNLKPTIIDMVPEHNALSPPMEASIAASLSDCARKFLGHEVRTFSITDQTTEAVDSGCLQRLALRLMESTVTLGLKSFAMPIDAYSARFERAIHFAGSH